MFIFNFLFVNQLRESFTKSSYRTSEHSPDIQPFAVIELLTADPFLIAFARNRDKRSSTTPLGKVVRPSARVQPGQA
jgi:hypothetical protein